MFFLDLETLLCLGTSCHHLYCHFPSVHIPLSIGPAIESNPLPPPPPLLSPFPLRLFDESSNTNAKCLCPLHKIRLFWSGVEVTFCMDNLYFLVNNGAYSSSELDDESLGRGLHLSSLDSVRA